MVSTTCSCARDLVAGDAVAAVVLDGLERRPATRSGLHDRGHPLSPSLVGSTDHDGVEDVGVRTDR